LFQHVVASMACGSCSLIRRGCLVPPNLLRSREAPARGSCDLRRGQSADQIFAPGGATAALGVLRKHYRPRLRDVLRAEVERDYVKVPIPEIEKRLAG
jgi:hypothetical protein